jgi:hypothetical protein
MFPATIGPEALTQRSIASTVIDYLTVANRISDIKSKTPHNPI